MAMEFEFNETEADMVIEESVGYPRAYAKLCRDRAGFMVGYNNGPPFTFIPYAVNQEEMLRAKELDQMFPIIDPKAKSTGKPKIFVNLLWKQLNHLGNAGFDPAVIRVDSYGNVLYFHADKASPLAWDIDHWFPCQRGGLTLVSNLRILQWQVRKRKHNKLEFLVPWWDLQLGISVNQFLSIFASSNSDFRHRGFSFLFMEGESEELNDGQTVDSHSFPQHFIDSKEKLGLASSAVVIVSRRDQNDSTLKTLDYNRQIKPCSPSTAARKGKTSGFFLKENENPDFVTNPYQAIVMARDSLKQREEEQKMQAEIHKLDAEVDEIRKKSNEEKLVIQELEMQLIKSRRRAEKCRRLAESQSSYRTMLEKMIRDAMHQSVVYKEQVRLNQAASNALMARLEAQKAICDASEKELHTKFKQRDELEKQIRPEFEQARKRSRIDSAFFEEQNDRTVFYLPGARPITTTSSHKELRLYLEEEHKASEAEIKDENKLNEHERAIVALENEIAVEDKLKQLEIRKEKRHVIRTRQLDRDEEQEDEESRKERGRGNVERWLKLLLEDSDQVTEPQNMDHAAKIDDIITKMNEKFPLKEVEEHVQDPQKETKESVQEEIEEVAEASKTLSREGSELNGGRKSCESEKRKGKSLERSESARTLRRIPSSPLIIGMKKGVECMLRKKPTVIGDDEDYLFYEDSESFINKIKKAVKL